MQLIKVQEKNGQKVVSARELYKVLGYNSTQYSRWSKKHIIDNIFAIENEDYTSIDISVNGGNTTEFALKLDFAKKLCMISKTKVGEKIRDYFIECEKSLKQVTNNIPNSFSEALKLAYEQSLKIEEQQKILEEQKPKVIFAEALQVSNDSILIGELAKILKQNKVDIGQNRLFQWLRDHKYLISRCEQRNLPTQTSMDFKLFEIKTTTIINSDGLTKVNKTTKVTTKGQKYFINKLLAS